MKNSSKTVNLTATSSTSFVREGMHLDLVGYFKIPEETSESGETLCDFIDEAVCGETAAERIAGAKQALKVASGPCGLAYMVLAREGSNTLAEAIDYGQKAVADLKKEVAQQFLAEEDNQDPPPIRFDQYEVSSELFSQAVVDLAQLKWQAGMKTEALALLTEEMKNEAFEFYSDIENDLRDLAVSYMVQTGQVKEAQAYLQEHSDSEPQWRYLNALLHFLNGGDSLVARSALGYAFAGGTIAAHRLVEGKESLSHQGLLAFGLDKYIENTEPLWQVSEGAIEWLTELMADPLNFANRELEEIAKVNDDLNRWKRWEDLLESAHHFSEQENYKEARTALKASLREAERIDYSFLPFHACICELLDLYIDSKRPADELLTSIESRAKHFESQTSKSDAMTALHFNSIATLYEFFEEFEKSLHYHEKAVQQAELQLAESKSFLTLFDLVDMRNDMAYVLFKLEKYGEALPMFLKNREIEESFLGTKHSEVLESLEQAHLCAVKLGDEKSTAAILERIKAIDSEWEPESDTSDQEHDHDHGAPGHSCGH